MAGKNKGLCVNVPYTLRVSFLGVNFLYWCGSLGLLIWMAYYLLTDNQLQLDIYLGSQEVVWYLSAMLVLVYITGLFGYLAGVLKHKGLCVTYMVLVVICVLATVCYALLGKLYQSGNEFTEDQWGDLSDETRHTLQSRFECCSYDAVSAEDNKAYDVSCYGTTNLGNNMIRYDIHTEGCSDKMRGVEANGELYVSIVTVALSMEAGGMALAVLMYKTLAHAHQD